MGIKFDRILDGFDGPFAKVNGVLRPPAEGIHGPANPAGYLISHRINNSFTLVNRLLKGGQRGVLAEARRNHLGPGQPAARAILEKGAAELGVPVRAVSTAPGTDLVKLKPLRIGLYDQYGGLAPSGWTRWLFEQFEFPFEVVYPQTLDAGNLNRKYDVLVLTDGAFRKGAGGTQPAASSIPAEYRAWLGRITEEKTVPQLKQFVQAGGSLVTIGSSTGLAELLGVPVSDPLAGLSREQFYVPGIADARDGRYDQSAGVRHGAGSDCVLRQQPGVQAGRGCSKGRVVRRAGNARQRMGLGTGASGGIDGGGRGEGRRGESGAVGARGRVPRAAARDV